MKWALVVAALLGMPSALIAQGAQAQASVAFPHARHARLFPSCSGCHSGIVSGDSAEFFPGASACANCHDGTLEPRVRWTPPSPSGGAGLLAFSHATHLTKVDSATCERCHTASDTTERMNVAYATPQRCLTCHAHTASAHLAVDNACATCHRPLVAATGLSDARVASLPQPPSHARADFVSTHGSMARAGVATCAVCHARESCDRCHVDGARSPIIRTLGADARVARLERGKDPVYPTPADHHAANFLLLHGAAARADLGRCAVCHARASCQTCHTGQGAQDVVRRLPDAREATAPGVHLVPAPPIGASAVPTPTAVLVRAVELLPAPSQPTDTGTPAPPHRVTVHPADFVRTHGTVAASGGLDCAGCHTKRFCSDCHTGERVGHRYHPANFLATHAPQAYGRETDCATCHSTEAFCRACHRQAGLAAKTNARSTVFHNAEPLWLLQHGGAARQDLNSCTTCHQQTYCMQCHSDLGSRINPHGPDFDAARMARKNPQLCLMCHLKNPLGNRSP